MKTPNDTKRPNTHSGREDRERKRNYKYIWLSYVVVPMKTKAGLVQDVWVGRTYTPNKPGFAG